MRSSFFIDIGNVFSKDCGFDQSNINYYHGHLIMTLRDVSDEINCNSINGDVTNDSILNVTDIVLLINVILDESYDDLSICQLIASDYDFNQALNVVDIVALINIVISQL